MGIVSFSLSGYSPKILYRVTESAHNNVTLDFYLFLDLKGLRSKLTFCSSCSILCIESEVRIMFEQLITYDKKPLEEIRIFPDSFSKTTPRGFYRTPDDNDDSIYSIYFMNDGSDIVVEVRADMGGVVEDVTLYKDFQHEATLADVYKRLLSNYDDTPLNCWLPIYE